MKDRIERALAQYEEGVITSRMGWIESADNWLRMIISRPSDIELLSDYNYALDRAFEED